MVVFAHNGHWLASLMYLLPVIICLGFVLVAKIKDRRRPAGEPGVVTEAEESGQP